MCFTFCGVCFTSKKSCLLVFTKHCFFLALSREILYICLLFQVIIRHETYVLCAYKKIRFRTTGLQHTIREQPQPRGLCPQKDWPLKGDLDLFWLKETDWKNHTHPVTWEGSVPVPLDLKLVASQMRRKTTFVVDVRLRPGMKSLVPMSEKLERFKHWI